MRISPRFRPRISLRLVLCLVPVMGILFGWVGRHIQEHRAEQLAIEQIQASTPFQGSRASQISGGLPIFL